MSKGKVVVEDLLAVKLLGDPQVSHESYNWSEP